MYKGFFEREMFANISYRLPTHLLYTIPIKDILYEIYRRSMGDVQATSPVPCALYLSRFREICRRCCPVLTKFYVKIKLHITLLRSLYLSPVNKGMPSIGCSKACYGGKGMPPSPRSRACYGGITGCGTSDRKPSNKPFPRFLLYLYSSLCKSSLVIPDFC